MINLHNVDCMEYMRGLPDKCFDLAIVDPPYGIGCTKTIGVGDTRSGIKRKSKWEIKEWDNNPPLVGYFTELQRVSLNQIIFGGNYFADMLPASRCWVIWDKVHRIDNADAELAWTSFKKSARIYSYAAMNIMGFMNPNRFHPTEKPVALYKWLLSNYAKQGDRILDTYGGSMSIAIACHDMGFDLELCELDADYFAAGKARFEKHIAQGSLFEPQEMTATSIQTKLLL